MCRANAQLSVSKQELYINVLYNARAVRSFVRKADTSASGTDTHLHLFSSMLIPD